MALSKPCLTLVLGGLLSLTSQPSLAGGDVAAGKEKSATCVACHGPDGNSPSPAFPILAGQYADYLVQALKAYRAGTRQNAIMAGFASNLSDQDIADLAAYYASQEGLSVVKTPE